jgi:tRNA G37 N-methylase Trm5
VAANAYQSDGKKNGDFISLDVPYVPTPHKVVDKMLEMAMVRPGELVYDLGSGDGRIVVQAAKKYGARGIGVDMDPERVKEAKKNVETNGVKSKVEIREGNALKTDVSRADVVTLYLLPSVNMELRPKLQQLPSGTRIVSHDFDMGDWKPLRTETINEGGREHKIYLWEVGKGHQKTAQK